MKAIMKLMSSLVFCCSVSFIRMSPVPVPKKMRTGNNQLILMSLLVVFFPPTTNTNATNAKTIPIVATKFSFSPNSTTPAKVGNTTDNLLDNEVTVTPERCVEAVISR